MAVNLTPNAILRLNDGDLELRPVLQVMDIRQIGNAQSTQERYRLVLSDGVYVQQAMLATQLNEFIKNGQAQKGSIVQLLEYICNTVQNRKIIIVLNMEVVQSIAEIIGDPKTLASGSDQVGGSPNVNNVRQQQWPAPQQDQQQRPAPHQQQVRVSPLISGQSLPQPQQPSNTAMGNGGEFRQGGGVSGAQGISGSYPSVEIGVHGPYPGNAYQGQRQASMNSGTGGIGSEGGGFAQQSTFPRTYQTPTPMYSVKGPIAKNEAPARVVPIAGLNPYQGRWTIKARVTSKGDLRRFHNARGEGKVFSFDLLDADGGEIRCTGFNNVADQFYEKVDVGRVYLLSRGSLKPSQKQFNHLKNEWEIMLENASTLELCADEDNSIPQQVFDFKPISDVENMENNAMVDLIGVVLGMQDTLQIMRKNGTEASKRTLTMSDRSGRSVELTMWGQFCNKEGDEIQQQIYSGTLPILAVKAGRVSDFSGKSVGTLNSSQLLINPDIPEAHRLRDWHDREGKNSGVQSISKEGGTSGRPETRKFVAQIKDEGLGKGEKPDWISIRATICFIKSDNFCYTACPLKISDKQCSKKVTNNGDGTWRCDRCDRSVPECDYRYLLQIQVQDHTSTSWVSGFQEAGEEIFGVSARDLFMWKQDESPRFTDIVQKVLFSTRVFKLKVKEETFQDEQRVKSTVTKSDKVNFATESKLLLDLITQVERGEFPIAGKATAVSYTTASTGVTYVGGPPHRVSNFNSSHGGTLQGSHSAGGYEGGYGGGGGYPSGNVSANAYGSGAYPSGNASANAYSATNSTKCYKCGKEGHLPHLCTFAGGRNDSFQGGGGGYGAVGGTCYKCGQGGHYARDCPSQNGGKGFGNTAGGGSGYGGRGF